MGYKCMFCGSEDTKVIDSQTINMENINEPIVKSIKRLYYSCNACGGVGSVDEVEMKEE